MIRAATKIRANNMQKYCAAGRQATDGWITQVTNTQSHYVINIGSCTAKMVTRTRLNVTLYVLYRV